MILNDQEFNLARMVRETIIKAIQRYPDETLEQLSIRLGISERGLLRHMKHFKIKIEKKTFKYLKC